MSLKEVFCQARGISLLQRAFAGGRVPHAYIFAGAEGVGKFKTALEWGRLLLCKGPVVEDGDGGWADSCGSCESCRAIESGSHPDFNLIYKELIKFTRDGKDKKPPVKVPIDVIREFVVEKVSVRPALSSRKVYIISEAEKLNDSSQNCLLKVLEEPPEYCCIILLCTRMEKLLATTKSRCQIIRFGPVDEEIIFEKVREAGIGAEQGRYFARLAQGSLGLACRWAELEANEAGLYETKRGVVESVVGLEYADIPEVASSLLGISKGIAGVWAELEEGTSRKDINRKATQSVVRMVISVLYDAMKLRAAGEEGMINFDQRKLVERLAGRLGVEELAERISGCYEVLLWIEAGVNEKLIFEQLLFNLSGSDKMRV